jgi:GT2 family glycosyltransferase
MVQPVVNITIPVFNRFDLTQKTILALRKSGSSIPFSITVVDNGSNAALVQRLQEFYQDAVIDKLFLLPKNMGISCACNIGWQMTEAPFYCKLDNDMLIQTPDWLEKLFNLWRHGKQLSTLGPAWNEDMLLVNEGSLHTPDGILGVCVKNLPGAAIFIPKAVSDILGYWNEDYGIYGAEDGDYGLRMRRADFPQYYYLAEGLVQHMHEDSENLDYSLDRKEELQYLFFEEQGKDGLFLINSHLYKFGIRNLNVPRKYEIMDVNKNCKVRLKIRKEYLPVRDALERCQTLIRRARASKNPDRIFAREFLEKLIGIMRDCGQACPETTVDVCRRVP